jgi:transcriptional regulatory protein LevR
MKPASIHDIKKELLNHDSKQMIGYCLRLAKFKKENKEMLSFLLFEEENISNFIVSVKNETEEEFKQINTSNIYFIKKSIRKILRNVNKQIRFSMSRQVEIELLIHFCNCFILHSIPIEKSRPLSNLYQNQLNKIEKLLAYLHPDLQHDMQKQLIR